MEDMNKETAAHKRDDALKNFTRNDVHCPLLNDTCRWDCECIEKPTAFNRSGKNHKAGVKAEDTPYKDLYAWEVSDWACGNAMFSGERYEQNTNY